MNREDENQSSQEEGFYKPVLKVLTSNDEENIIKTEGDPFDDGAKDLIVHNRPTDFLPRTLTVMPPFYTTEIDNQHKGRQPDQELIPIKRQKIKKCKYLSLKDKYLNNALYKLIYAKIDPSTEYNSYIYCLNHTTDYNPNDYRLPIQNENHGKFQSRFECGNLLYAYQSIDSKIEQYDCILQNDTNTKGYNQWFYFSFKNGQSGSVKFNFVNMVKKHSLFEEGVRPVGCFVGDGHGWQSIGRNIDYQKSYVCRQVQGNPATYKNYYTLSFTVDFPHRNSLVYIALNYPYSYTKMIKFIQSIQHKYESSSLIISRQILCHTISNNALPYLRIRHQDYVDGGKKILIMGRQHPGETVGSFVLQGFIKNILTQDKLLKNYQIILIPMVNVDGVIYGNFRTNLAGFDLNRQWTDSNRWLHPQVFYLERFISGLQNISFVMDFHGHSKKFNSFIYACNGQQTYQFRVFPYLCGKTFTSFSMKDCTYSVTADKERTARIKLFKQIKKPQIFTLQTSFFGYETVTLKKCRFTISDLFKIGDGMAESLKFYLLKKKEMQQYQKEVKEKQYLFDQWAFQNKDDIDSQSNPSEDELTPVERKEKVLAQKQQKKTKRRSKSKKKKKSDREKQSINLIMTERVKFLSDQKSDNRSEQVIKIEPNLLNNTLVRKKTETQRTISLKEVKPKSKKMEKIISIVEPQPPKNPQPMSVIPTTTKAKQTIQKVDPRPKSLKMMSANNNISKKKIQDQQAHNAKIAASSNLFNKTNYYAQLHQKLQHRQTKSNMHQKTQSLQINNLKKEVIAPNANNMDVLRKLMVSEQQPIVKKQIRTTDAPRPRHKDKVYIIRQNRIINSVTRVNEEQIKRNLEIQISNRTQALRNCQKKMYEMSFEEPILEKRDDQKLSYASTLKGYKFPNIRVEKKLQYFNF